MGSLLVDMFHDVDDAQNCLEMCQQSGDCEYFTFYEEDHSCLTFVNCLTFSTNSCTNCFSGESSCEGMSRLLMSTQKKTFETK